MAIQFCGILMMFGAAGLNYWARKHLGIFYVQGSKVQEDHQLIESGPYALMRHPLFYSYPHCQDHETGIFKVVN